jgi:predicted dehydrogenase
VTRVPLCLVGCGGMGSRHVSGYAALESSGLSNIDLVAVCDLRADNAERVADEAERLLGRRPQVFLSLAEALQHSGAEAYDVVTDVSGHLPLVRQIAAAGKHVLCEKPLALTVRACQSLVDVAEQHDVVLATAENYRRDPTNRLAKAVIDSGVLGKIHLMRQTLVGGSDRILITPWRHLKEKGAMGLDMGVHLTDLIQYYFGPFANVYGEGFIAEPVRYRQEVLEFESAAYAQRHAEIPDQVVATGEDSFVAMYRMESGVRVQVAYVPSGPGALYQERTVHGRLGSLEIFRDRTGQAPVLHRDGETVTGRALADLVGGVELDPLTRALFGDDFSYSKPFADTDAGLLAIEVHDFAEAVLTGRRPEIDGWGGLTAVAAVLGVYESGLRGEALAFEDVVTGRVASYQDDLDRLWAEAAAGTPQ